MKYLKTFTKIAVFSLIFLFLFDYISYVLKPYTNNLINIAGFYGERKNSLDVVYLASSAGFQYFQPLSAYEDYGYTSYVFSSETLPAEGFELLVKETLKRQDPTLLIIDLRSFQRREELPPDEVAYRNFLTGMPFSIDKIKFINKNVPLYLGDEVESYYFDFIKFHTNTQYNNMNIAFDMMFNKFQNPLKGYQFANFHAIIEKPKNKTNNIRKLPKETDLILDNLLKLLKSTKKEVLFVISPYQELLEYKETYNYMEEKITKAGFAFLDFNLYIDEIGLDFKKDFYNVNHVNTIGANKYTKYLAKYIAENYSLKDHRKDPDYKDWNDLLDYWDAENKNGTQVVLDLIKEHEKELKENKKS